MAITAWTTPRDWAADELITEAMMDTHVKDNLTHLYEKSTIKFYHDTHAASENHSNATVTATSCSVSVVLDYVSNVLAIGSAMVANDNDHDDTYNYLQLMRDGVGMGPAPWHIAFNGEPWPLTVMHLAADLAIGTYTYAIGGWPSSGAGDIYTTNKMLSVIVIPVHG